MKKAPIIFFVVTNAAWLGLSWYTHTYDFIVELLCITGVMAFFWAKARFVPNVRGTRNRDDQMFFDPANSILPGNTFHNTDIDPTFSSYSTGFQNNEAFDFINDITFDPVNSVIAGNIYHDSLIDPTSSSHYDV